MLSLHTNQASLSAQNSISRSQGSLSTSMARLSTGYRINSAMDDAAGLQIATRLKAQTSGMAMAMRNTQNATSMMQTAEGALAETTNLLVRMKDLATQAADGASTDADRTAMQAEFDALGRELSNIVGNTSFGGAKLLTRAATAGEKSLANGDAATAAATLVTKTDAYDDGAGAGAKPDYDAALATYTATPDATNKTALDAAAVNLKTAEEELAAAQNANDVAASYSAAATASTVDGKFAAALSFQIGASSAETMSLNLSTDLTNLHTALKASTELYNSFGASTAGVGDELTAAGSASSAIDKLSAAIDAVGTVRSSLGAAANRLDHVHSNLANISSNTEAATGRIMDVDFATESSNMTTKQMLLQAGTAMLKQSNGLSGMVMSLLQ